jgi:hypothetical protein
MFGPPEGCRFRGGRILGGSSRELIAADFVGADMHDVRPNAVRVRNVRLCPGHNSKF